MDRQFDDNVVMVCLDETSKQESLPSAMTGAKGDLSAPIQHGLAIPRPTIKDASVSGSATCSCCSPPLEGWRLVRGHRPPNLR